MALTQWEAKLNARYVHQGNTVIVPHQQQRKIAQMVLSALVVLQVAFLAL